MSYIKSFPSHKQQDDYSCGVKALESVFIYYGIKVSEREIAKIAGTDENGTPVVGLEAVLKKFRFKFVSKKMSVGEVKKYIDRNVPVIILFQDDRKDKKAPWRRVWDCGHYTVAIGHDRGRIYFDDPDRENITYLSFSEFKDRWHDLVRGRKYWRRGLAIFGPDEEIYWQNAAHVDDDSNLYQRKRG